MGDIFRNEPGTIARVKGIGYSLWLFFTFDPCDNTYSVVITYFLDRKEMNADIDNKVDVRVYHIVFREVYTLVDVLYIVEGRDSLVAPFSLCLVEGFVLVAKGTFYGMQVMKHS